MSASVQSPPYYALRLLTLAFDVKADPGDTYDKKEQSDTNSDCCSIAEEAEQLALALHTLSFSFVK